MYQIKLASLKQAQILYFAAVEYFGLGPCQYMSVKEIKNHNWERDPWVYVYTENEWAIVVEDQSTAVLLSLKASYK